MYLTNLLKACLWRKQEARLFGTTKDEARYTMKVRGPLVQPKKHVIYIGTTKEARHIYIYALHRQGCSGLMVIIPRIKQ